MTDRDLKYSLELQRIARSLDLRAATNSADVFRFFRGASPEVVWPLLTPEQRQRLLHAVAIDEPRDQSPDAHPLDFEWKFERDTAERLLTALRAEGPRIGLLGVPTVASLLRNGGVQWWLAEANPIAALALDSRFVHRVDLNAAVFDPPFSADAVLLDPPWYMGVARHWLAVALRATRPGGLLLSTLWGDMTRPSAADERAELLAELRAVGPLELCPGSLIYETPAFERATWRQLGLPDLANWRTADLVALRVECPGCFRSPALPRVAARWWRFLFGSRQVALRNGPDDTDVAPRLLALQASGAFFLRSVSRRDSDRGLVDLWTSRGFAARVVGRSHFLAALHDMVRGTESVGAALSARQQLTQVMMEDGVPVKGHAISWESIEYADGIFGGYG